VAHHIYSSYLLRKVAVDIHLIGFGVVGQGLVEILRDKSADLRRDYDFLPRLVAVNTRSRGSLYHPDGLQLNALLEAAARGHLDSYPDAPGLERGADALALLARARADVVVEATPTNPETGQPALDLCLTALRSGQHVVLANKGPIAVAYDRLRQQAAASGRLLRCEGTVMAGTPAIRLAAQALAGCRISEARGILNGTTNYILTQMENGLGYEMALAQAQSLGYAEADPTADVGGFDAAAKILILARLLFDRAFTLADLEIQGITGITAADAAAARAAGERWKLIARVTPDGGSVRPVRLPLTDPLAGVSGAYNAITYETDLLGAVTLVGPGAGRAVTGFALLADLLDIHSRTAKIAY
jgi:homoserine dehydrogenase